MILLVVKLRSSYIIAIIVVIIVVIAGAAFVATLSGNGTVTLLVKDPPSYSSDVSSINVTFSKIELNQVVAGGNESWVTLTGTSTIVDLLKIINATETLGSFNVPVGNYSQIRFMVSSVTARINGQIVILSIPSGNETGLKVHFEEPFQLKSGETVTITIDIRANDFGIHNGLFIPSISASIS